MGWIFVFWRLIFLLEFVYEAEGSVAVNDPEEYQVQFDVSLEELICISIGAANL